MNDLTTSSTEGTLIEVPPMSTPLHGCLHRVQTSARFGTDDTAAQDADLSVSTWIAPTWVSERLRAEAEALLPFYQRAAYPAPEQSFLRWLNVLWLGLPKSKGNAERWEAIKLVYAALLGDFPAGCFTKRTLQAARDRFKFFPGTNELAGFLAPYRNEITNNVYRLRVVSKTSTQRPQPGQEPERPKRTPEELQSLAAITAKIRANLTHGPQPAKPAAKEATP